MRALERNKRTLHYAVYVREEPLLDEQGFETGESQPIYGEIMELRCNISPATGEEAVEAFGTYANYSRAVCVADNNCPLAENASQIIIVLLQKMQSCGLEFPPRNHSTTLLPVKPIARTG